MTEEHLSEEEKHRRAEEARLAAEANQTEESQPEEKRVKYDGGPIPRVK